MEEFDRWNVIKQDIECKGVEKAPRVPQITEGEVWWAACGKNLGVLPKNDLESIIEEIPLNKIGNTKDITRCIEWLIEDEYTTGQVISINGGWVIT